MKKFLILLALAAGVACSTEDETQNKESAKFAGTMIVTSNQTPSLASFEMKNVLFELTEDKDGTINLTMHEIRFAAAMPMTLNIVIPKLKFEDKNKDDVQELISTVDPIIPYIGGRPYDAFLIPEFSGTFANGKLNITFTCENPQIPVGDETLNHKAVYTGSILL